MAGDLTASGPHVGMPRLQMQAQMAADDLTAAGPRVRDATSSG